MDVGIDAIPDVFTIAIFNNGIFLVASVDSISTEALGTTIISFVACVHNSVIAHVVYSMAPNWAID